MATYLELRQAAEDGPLLIKIQVACIISANVISKEAVDVPLHTQRLKWAAQAYSDPVGTARMMVWAVLAENRAFTQAQILAASDATIQLNVDNSVNLFATGMV